MSDPNTPSNNPEEQSIDQLSIARELNGVLEQVSNRLERIQQLTKTQSDFINAMTESFSQMENFMSGMSESSAQMEEALNEASNAALERFSEKNVERVNKGLEKVANSYEEASNRQQKSLEKMSNTVSTMSDATSAINNNMKKSTSVINKHLTSGRGVFGKFHKNSIGINKEANVLVENVKELAGKISKLMKGFGKAIQSTLAVGGALVKGISRFVFSLVGAAAKFVKFAATVPFTIMKHAVSIGNTIRRDLVEVIQSAAEGLKEKFDMNSNIGKGIQAMTARGKGMLLAFQNPSAELVKLFGFGASGIANMIGFMGENIDAMGHFSEIFGKSLMKDPDRLKRFAKMVKGFGFTSEDVAYMALDAATNMKHINVRMAELGVTLESTSKEFGVDRKRLSKNFMILRKDITQFGHLSDEEIARTTARLTQMKVKLEDAAAVFKKFSTFQDAANSVAMLSQTFGMNLDAMDMIKAQNPEEIIDMFRTSMLETGRSFQDLNRFEKDLMAQHTGMSAESLSALMNYRDLGLTHEEAVKRMESEKPTAKQMKAIKKLNSAIKEVQKIMTFESPFQAFFKGLASNVALSKDLRGTLTSLSSGYQGIYEYALNLDPNTWIGLIKPIKLVIEIMSSILRSDAFKGGLVSTIKSIADFTAQMFGATRGDVILSNLEVNIGMAMKKGGELSTKKQKADFNKMIVNSVKSYETHLSGIVDIEEMKKIKNPLDLIRKLNQYKQSLDPSQKSLIKKFDSMMVAIGEKINVKYKTNQNTKTQKKNQVQKVKTAKSDTMLAQGLIETVDKNTGNLAKLIKLSGRIAGAVIKGAAIGFTALLKVLNTQTSNFEADQAKNKGKKKKNMIEEFLHFEPGEFGKIADSIRNAFLGFFESMKNTNKGTTIFGWFLAGITDAISLVFNFFVDTLKSGVNEILGKEIFEKSTSSMISQAQMSAIKDPGGSKGLGASAVSDMFAKASQGEDISTQSIADLVVSLENKISEVQDPTKKKSLQSQVSALREKFEEEGKTDEGKKAILAGAAKVLKETGSKQDLVQGQLIDSAQNMDENIRVFSEVFFMIAKKANAEGAKHSSFGDSPYWLTSIGDIVTRINKYSNTKGIASYLGSLDEFKEAYKNKSLSSIKTNPSYDFSNFQNYSSPYWDTDYIIGFGDSVKYGKGFGVAGTSLLDVLKYKTAYVHKATENTRVDVPQEITQVDVTTPGKTKVKSKDFISDMFNRIMGNMPIMNSNFDIVKNMIYGVSSPAISDEDLDLNGAETTNVAKASISEMIMNRSSIPKTNTKRMTKADFEAISGKLKEELQKTKDTPIEIDGFMNISEEITDLIAKVMIQRNLAGKMTRADWTMLGKSLSGSATKSAGGDDGAFNNGQTQGYSSP